MKRTVEILFLALGAAECFSPSLPPISPLHDETARISKRDTQIHTHMSTTSNNENQSLDRRSLILGAATVAAASILSPPYATAAPSTPSPIPSWTLDSGVQFPILALNTVGLSATATELALLYATQAGITHIDFHPGQERDGVAQYLSHNPSARANLFLNTKIRKAPPGTSPADAARNTRLQIEQDLRILGVDRVDMLMLRDSPDPRVIQAQYAVLEEALEKGQTRSLGVINFCQGALTAVLETAKVKPALNYYMLHVGMGRDAHGLRTFAEEKGIRTFAYGAVGEPGPSQDLLNNGLVQKIGNAHGKDPEEVALRWVTQGGAGVSVRPTTNFGLGTSACVGSACETGIQKRASSFGWELTRKEMKALDALTSPDDNPTLFSSSGCPNAFDMTNYLKEKDLSDAKKQ